jgi:hypothetical protein
VKSTSRAESTAAAFSQVQEAKVKVSREFKTTNHIRRKLNLTLRTAATGTGLTSNSLVLGDGALTSALASWTRAYFKNVSIKFHPNYRNSGITYGMSSGDPKRCSQKKLCCSCSSGRSAGRRSTWPGRHRRRSRLWWSCSRW